MRGWATDGARELVLRVLDQLQAEREVRKSAEAMIPKLLPGDCSESKADEHPDNYCWAHERNVWECVAALIAERATLTARCEKAERERDEAREAMTRAEHKLYAGRVWAGDKWGDIPQAHARQALAILTTATMPGR